MYHTNVTYIQKYLRKVLSEELRKRWVESGMSQERFADYIGISRSAFIAILNGESDPFLSTFFTISNVLGKDFFNAVNRAACVGEE